MELRVLAFSLLIIGVSNIGHAGPVEDLAGVLNGRTGAASEDRRHDVNKNVLGVNVKVGCRGDTLDANVQITGVSGRLDGDTAVITVTYSGSYVRQGWDIPCQRVSSDLHGVETRHVSGTYSFTVTGKPFQKPAIVWGNGSDFKEVESSGHDSNVFAIRAIQNAVSTAF